MKNPPDTHRHWERDAIRTVSPAGRLLAARKDWTLTVLTIFLVICDGTLNRCCQAAGVLGRIMRT